ncbi:hypothetical protein EIP86_007379 [Pleurotus ostreatoroseus]|nr:hypothetical protein EIP86_007379 [Pleurotus ostreatoroseus]
MPLVTEKASGSSQNRFKPYDESKRPSKGKGKRSATAGDESGSDWEPEEAAYSESEDWGEPDTPPRPVRDPNRVPEIERQAAMNIHKVKSWQLRRIEVLRTEPDPKKPGKQLTYYKLQDVIALASNNTYASPIKSGRRNHIERMRNPTSMDLLRRQRAARRANEARDGGALAPTSESSGAASKQNKTSIFHFDFDDDDDL